MPQCEVCGSEMVLRTVRQGQRRGSRFYGCSNYPHCRYTKNFNHDGSDIDKENTTFDDEFFQAENINIRARPMKPGYQTSFFDSLAVSDTTLESLYVEDSNVFNLKQYSKWRIDYPVNNVNEVGDDISFIMSVAQKILMRGTVTICSKYAEQTYRNIFASKSFNLLPPWKYGTICSSNSQTGFQFDGARAERIFYDDILPKLMGPYSRL
jgi:ATP-dependent DNA helicase RecQ